jgi:transposase
MWTSKNRGRYDRSRLRYPSDLTDEEWALVEPLIPPARRGGNRRHVVVREVINGLMYILSTGCQWRAIPKDLVDSDAKCNPVDSIGSSTKSRVSHSERRPSARFPGDKDGSARRNIEPLQ